MIGTFWIFKLFVLWHSKKYWPQLFQLEVKLNQFNKIRRCPRPRWSYLKYPNKKTMCGFPVTVDCVDWQDFKVKWGKKRGGGCLKTPLTCWLSFKKNFWPGFSMISKLKNYSNFFSMLTCWHPIQRVLRFFEGLLKLKIWHIWLLNHCWLVDLHYYEL